MSAAQILICSGVVLYAAAIAYFEWQSHKHQKHAEYVWAETALLIADIEAMTSDPTRKKGKTK